MTDIADCSDQFESAAVANFGQETALMASIAISLKRLADNGQPRSSSGRPEHYAPLVQELRARADDYRAEGPSAEHTAKLLDRAAISIASEAGSHDEAINYLRRFHAAWGQGSGWQSAMNALADDVADFLEARGGQ